MVTKNNSYMVRSNIQVMRDGKQMSPKIGEHFNFTDKEVEFLLTRGVIGVDTGAVASVKSAKDAEISKLKSQVESLELELAGLRDDGATLSEKPSRQSQSKAKK